MDSAPVGVKQFLINISSIDYIYEREGKAKANDSQPLQDYSVPSQSNSGIINSSSIFVLFSDLCDFDIMNDTI